MIEFRLPPIGDAQNNIYSLYPSSNLRIEVQVNAITPRGPNATETIFIGFLNDSKLYLNPDKNEKFKRILEDWVNLYKPRLLVENLKTSLIVSIWVFKGDEVYTVVPEKMVPYKPIQALRGLITATISIEKNELKFLERINATKILEKVGGSKGFRTLGESISFKYEWVKIPEYSWEPTEYMKIPILMVENPENYSARIYANIEFNSEYVTEFKLTVTMGNNIIELTANGETAIPLTIYSGDVTIGSKYGFSKIIDVTPSYIGYIWISAMPAHIHYRERKTAYWLGVPVWSEWTGREKIEDMIRSIETDPNAPLKIVGDEDLGRPKFFDIFYNASEIENPKVPDTYIADGDLDYKESVMWSEIIEHYDVYKTGFGLGIPIGAMAVAFSGISGAYAFLISGLAVSVGYEKKAIVRISGSAENFGVYKGIGFNVTEILFVAVSRYRYSTSDGKLFKVPFGLYVKFYSGAVSLISGK